MNICQKCGSCALHTVIRLWRSYVYCANCHYTRDIKR